MITIALICSVVANWMWGASCARVCATKGPCRLARAICAALSALGFVGSVGCVLAAFTINGVRLW